MANDKDASDKTSNCTICGEKFLNVQECYRHELVTHGLQKKSNPNGRVQKRVTATVKFLNTTEKVTECASLKQRLSKCKNGEEIRTIIELFCMKTDHLDLVFTRIQTCLEKELRSAGSVRIYPFGSIASGLALRDCDIDVFVDVSNVQISPIRKNGKQNHSNNITIESEQRKVLNRINGLLQRSTHFSNVFAIRFAKVPIIRCLHNDTGFSIDINVTSPSSRENTRFIYDLVQSDKRIHETMLFLKLWGKNTKNIGRENMTSYCLITMVIFFLQQPRKSEDQGTGDNNYRILKSIKELQKNIPFHMVQGVNYAYDLSSEENKPKIPDCVTSWDLIKGFFDFYQNFNFEDHVISPYFGRAVAKNDLTPEICEEYNKQLRTITQYTQGEQAQNLQIDRSVCVQDAFCLNQNTARNISFHNREYLILCLRNAQTICMNPKKLQLGALYHQLLFETIGLYTNNNNNAKEKDKAMLISNLQNLKLPMIESNKSISTESSLTYTRLPSKADLRAVVSHFPNITSGEDILRCWCQLYSDAIATLISKLYRMEMQKQMPSEQKQQKLDDEEKHTDLNQSWAICCTIDLWNNRHFQKNSNTSFMSYQLEQTERLHALRRQDPNFSVTLNGILKLNVLQNYGGIDIKLQLMDGDTASNLNKKSPLRKFFCAFKNTLQNFNLKDFLNESGDADTKDIKAKSDPDSDTPMAAHDL